jgi:hypothetical protein
MSLFNFFKVKDKNPEKQSETESRKRKHEDINVDDGQKNKKQCQESYSKKDKKYDATRERKFIGTWLDDFDWLQYEKDENLMFCKYCRKYPKLAVTKLNQTCVFVEGSRNFRLEPIRSHNKSTAHKNCANQFLRDEEKSSLEVPTKKAPEIRNTDIGKALHKLGEKECQRMKFVFNCAYSLAYHNKPFTDMKMMCTLMKKNSVDLPDNYDNDVRAREFAYSIAECIQLDAVNDILNSPYVSILADGSTDVSFREQEIVYLRYLSDGEVKTRFISLEELKSSDAKGVKEGIDSGLSRFGIEFSDLTDTGNGKPTLVCANFDGASVMQGLKTGTMSMILKDAPWVFPMHCVAHKLELAALDSVRTDSYLRKFEDIVKGIYMFYHFSPKRRREVKEVAEFLGSELVHMSGIKQVNLKHCLFL